MSQLLGDLRPLNIPISGNADGTGAATIIFGGRKIFWSAVYAAIEVSAGTPSIAIRDQADMPVIFGGAGQSILGPFMIPPGRVLKLVVTAAGANAAVKGQIIGWEAADPAQLPPALPNSSSVSISGGTVTATITSGTVSISGTPTVQFAPGQSVTFTNAQIAVLNVAGNLLNTQQPQVAVAGFPVAVLNDGVNHDLGNFTLPVGTHALGFTFSGTTLSSLKVIGVTSGVDYASGISEASTQFVTVKVLSGIDSQVDIQVLNRVAAGSNTVRCVTILDVMDVNSWPLAARVQDWQGTNQVGVVVNAGGDHVMLVQEGTAPPLWQAPRAFASNEVLNAITSVTVVAGVLGQTLRVFGWNIEIDQATGTTVAFLEDSSFAVGAVGGRFAAASSNGLDSHSGYLGGLPLAVGAGVRLNVALLPAATGAVRAQVSYSQG